MKLLDVLSSKDCWTQGTGARDSEGKAVNTLSSSACRFCLSGAICRVRGNVVPTWNDYYEPLTRVIKVRFGDRIKWGDSAFNSVIQFNDHPATTFDDVVTVVKEAGLG